MDWSIEMSIKAEDENFISYVELRIAADSITTERVCLY